MACLKRSTHLYRACFSLCLIENNVRGCEETGLALWKTLQIAHDMVLGLKGDVLVLRAVVFGFKTIYGFFNKCKPTCTVIYSELDLCRIWLYLKLLDKLLLY